MEKILVSACLAGDVVRYDGRRVPLKNNCLDLLNNKGLLYKYCPEVAGGMPIPRAAAQIVGGTGFDVLAGRANVMDVNGNDVTRFFIDGAEYALNLVRTLHIRIALLKEKSPSCGSHFIYDGTFGKNLIRGSGVTAAILSQNKINIFSENEIREFEIFVKQSFPSLHSGLRL